MKTHSTLLIVVLLLLLPGIVSAQSSAVPGFISYQGYVTDLGDVPVGNASPENHEIIFRVWDTATGGVLQYSEIQLVTISKGEFSVLIGQGAAVSGEASKGPGTISLSDVFNGSGRYLGITVAAATGPNGITGTDQEITPRQRMVSSAFTFRAKEAETVVDASVSLAGLANNSVNATKIVDGSISSADLANLSVTFDKIAANAVNSSRIVDYSITANDIAAGAVGTSEIADNSITASDIATNGVAAAEIAAGAVGSSEIADNSITASDIATNGVTAAEIAAGAVGSSELSNGAVTAAKLGIDVGLWLVSGSNVYRTAGRAGIGTADPKARFHVLGTEDASLADDSGFVVFGDLDSHNLVLDNNEIISRNNGVGSTLFLNSEGANTVLNLTSGNVGIGESSPNARLQINSTTNNNDWDIILEDTGVSGTNTDRVGMRISNNGFFEVSNSHVPAGGGSSSGNFARLSNSGTWSAVSDERQKREVAPEKGLLSAALELVPVRYRFNWEADSDSEKHLGFIAQNVEEHFPNFVTDDGEVKTLDYSSLSTVAIGALQELKAEKDAEIAARDEVIAGLESRLARLEALFSPPGDAVKDGPPEVTSN